MGSRQDSNASDIKRSSTSNTGTLPTARSSNKICKMKRVLRRHVKFLGPGMVASTNFLDPGNWAADLKAGSQFGNMHLFTLSVAIVCAVILQILACKLGCVTGRDLGQHCQRNCENRVSRRLLWRWGLLYPFWALAEVGVLFADMGELLGSAIAYSLLLPQLPAWGCVLLSFSDIILVWLLMRNESTSRAMNAFEIAITLLVFIIVIAALVLLAQVRPDWSLAFKGFLPSPHLLEKKSLFASIAIIGGIISPHSLFLGSSLATKERMDKEPADLELSTRCDLCIPPRHATTGVTVTDDPGPEFIQELGLPAPTISSVQTYLRHSKFDIAASLLTLPLILNSAVVVIASTEFSSGKLADVVAMHTLLKEKQGKALAVVYAVALLLSAQAAALSATLAGQTISYGLMGYRPSPIARRMLTRAIGAVPAFVVASHSGIKGLGTFMIQTQATISLILPFVAIPLAYFTSSSAVMTIKDSGRTKSFANKWLLKIVVSLLIFVICFANVYQICESKKSTTASS